MLSLIWPAIHLTVAVIRFGQSFSGGMREALVFLPMGFLSGGFFLFLVERARYQRQKLLTGIGFLLASPMAFTGSLLGGILLNPSFGVTLLGSLPLALGSFLGYLAGGYLAKREAQD